LWIIGYGLIQAVTPKLLAKRHPTGASTQWLARILILFPAGIALTLAIGLDPTTAIITGLGLYAIVFAVNSAVHSYLIVEWSDRENVSMNVGFYYMANAGGRLTGTILSGLVFQYYGLIGCLVTSSLFVATAALISNKLEQ
jgi:predicted MFS family arabinose efflux permease